MQDAIFTEFFDQNILYIFSVIDSGYDEFGIHCINKLHLGCVIYKYTTYWTQEPTRNALKSAYQNKVRLKNCSLILALKQFAFANK